MFPAPGRSDKPLRDGVLIGSLFGELKLILGARVGMLDVGLAVITTSSVIVLLLLLRTSAVAPYNLEGPGEFSVRNEAGSRERGVSLDG